MEDRSARYALSGLQAEVLAELPLLDVRNSALMRHCVATDRFIVTDFLGDGAYPAHRSEKEEVDAYIAAVEKILDSPGALGFTDGLAVYVRHMFPPEEIRVAVERDGGRRLVAFAALQRALDDAMDALEQGSFDPPQRDDYVYAKNPWLHDLLDRDGLLRLRPDNIDEDVVAEGVFVGRGVALHPHPLLAPLRELVWELLALVQRPELAVSIALHPQRFSAPADVQRRLLADYWSGIRITPGNLDSLDRKHTSTPTFHAADQDDPRRMFFPLLGTWFDWDRRSRHDADDPVKRLYIREVKPTTDRKGSELVAAWNRELHSERDTSLRRFTHVDGKECCYPAEDYPPSLDAPNLPPGKPEKCRKLWRVDGPLEDHEWAELVGLHFRGNELIGALRSDLPRHLREALTRIARTRARPSVFGR